jgi:hypothetical protein
MVMVRVPQPAISVPGCTGPASRLVLDASADLTRHPSGVLGRRSIVTRLASWGEPDRHCFQHRRSHGSARLEEGTAGILYYTFARPHASLGRKVPPAMAAGLSDHVWTARRSRGFWTSLALGVQ